MVGHPLGGIFLGKEDLSGRGEEIAGCAGGDPLGQRRGDAQQDFGVF
jgi:hypothetical protein